MKFIALGMIASAIVSSCEAATTGNLRNLQVSNCRLYNDNGSCRQCIFRYILSNGQCNAVSDQCNTWNTTNGDCTSCFPGYELSSGKCVLEEGGEAPTVNGEPCLPRNFVRNGVCVEVSDQCKTWNNVNGDCTSCYEGWTLRDGDCVIEGGQEPETVNGVPCLPRNFVRNGVCVEVSDQCNTWNNVNGDCTSCYEGWTLKDGDCIIEEGGEAPTVNGVPCLPRNFVRDGVCVEVSDQCKTWNNVNGDCTSCYEGWTLRDGDCVIADAPSQGGSNGGSCFFREVRINGQCVKVNDQCRTWNTTTAACTSCYGGYTLSNGACRSA